MLSISVCFAIGNGWIDSTLIKFYCVFSQPVIIKINKVTFIKSLYITSPMTMKTIKNLPTKIKKPRLKARFYIFLSIKSLH